METSGASFSEDSEEQNAFCEYLELVDELGVERRDEARQRTLEKYPEFEAELRDIFNNEPRTSAMNDLEVGSVIANRYRLLQRLGEGGMGTVWLAQQQTPVRRLVALKVIKRGMDSQQILARFDAERQALALMEHDSIATFHDAGITADGRSFFVMEFVKGAPITDFCDRVEMPLTGRLELLQRVCIAVQHAHQKGVIHRDLKPSNILVSDRVDQLVVKVIDFGLAKALTSKLGENTIYTEHGQIIGTLQYMPPEQAELSALGVDTRADVYALGAILFELISGSPPLQKSQFKDVAYDAIVRLIRDSDVPRPSVRLAQSQDHLASIAATRRTEPKKLLHELNGDLDWITLKAIEKNRMLRYASAEDLRRDIDRYLRNEAIEARPPSTIYRVNKWFRRHRIGAAFAVVSLIALLTTIAAISYGLFQSQASLAIAVAAKVDLEVQTGIAKEEAVRATNEEANAERQRSAAERNEQTAKTRLYAQVITAAYSALENGDYVTGQKFLLRSDVALRDTEFNLLQNKLNKAGDTTFRSLRNAFAVRTIKTQMADEQGLLRFFQLLPNQDDDSPSDSKVRVAVSDFEFGTARLVSRTTITHHLPRIGVPIDPLSERVMISDDALVLAIISDLPPDPADSASGTSARPSIFVSNQRESRTWRIDGELSSMDFENASTQLSRDGNWLTHGTAGGTIRVVHISTREQFDFAEVDPYCTVAFAERSDLLAFADRDGAVHLASLSSLSLNEGASITSVLRGSGNYGENSPTVLALSLEHNTLAIGTSGGVVSTYSITSELIDAVNDRSRTFLESMAPHFVGKFQVATSKIASLSIGRETTIAATDTEGWCSVYECQNKAMLLRVRGHLPTELTSGTTLASDVSSVVTIGGGDTVYRWRIPGERFLATDDDYAAWNCGAIIFDGDEDLLAYEHAYTECLAFKLNDKQEQPDDVHKYGVALSSTLNDDESERVLRVAGLVQPNHLLAITSTGYAKHISISSKPEILGQVKLESWSPLPPGNSWRQFPTTSWLSARENRYTQISLDEDQRVSVVSWNTETGIVEYRRPIEFTTAWGKVTHYAFISNGNLAVLGSDTGSVGICDIRTGQDVRICKSDLAHIDEIIPCGLSNAFWVTSGQNPTFIQRCDSLTLEFSSVNSLDGFSIFSNDSGSRMVQFKNDGMVFLDGRSLETVATFALPKSEGRFQNAFSSQRWLVRISTYSPSGAVRSYPSSHTTFAAWNTSPNVIGGAEYPNAIGCRFTSDGAKVAIAHPGLLEVVDVKTLRRTNSLSTVVVPGRWTVSHSGKLVAIVLPTNSLLIWDYVGDRLSTIAISDQCADGKQVIGFSKNDRSVNIATRTGGVLRVDLETTSITHICEGTSSSVVGVEVSTSGRYFVITTERHALPIEDGSLPRRPHTAERIVDTETMKTLAIENADNIAFSSDESYWLVNIRGEDSYAYSLPGFTRMDNSLQVKAQVLQNQLDLRRLRTDDLQDATLSLPFPLPYVIDENSIVVSRDRKTIGAIVTATPDYHKGLLLLRRPDGTRLK